MSLSNPSPSPHPRQNGVAIACILSGGLIAAAIINSHRPVVPVAALEASTAGSTVVAAVAARPVPPIAQEAAQQQFEVQMNALTFQPLRVNGTDYYYKGVSNVEAEYDPKVDSLTFDYAPQWKSNAGVDCEDAERVHAAQAFTDGYGHYKGDTDLCGLTVAQRVAHFTIR